MCRVEDVENIESLRWDDQQKIRKYIESGGGTSTSKLNSSAAEDTEYGYISEWSKCSYSTCEPKRIEGKWKIPQETNNQYLKKVCN